MSAKATTAGFVMAGLVSAGALTVLVVEQPAPVKTVQFVAPAADVATPTETVEPVVTTTEAPAPVESTTAPAPVVAPAPEAPVAVKSPAPAPKPGEGAQPFIAAPDGHPLPPPVMEPRNPDGSLSTFSSAPPTP